MSSKKEKLRFLLPPAITLLIYSIVLAVKGIYPFGNNTIDYYDMAQQIAAFYYHVYDALHGTKGFFYDWYTALGVNMAMSTSGCSNISPFNLFFLLIRRSSLLKSLSVFNGLKLMCMSLTMYFYIKKTHEKSPEFFTVAASVGYSFCGFVLVLYITNQWIDIAVMFPLIMYFYDRMMKTGKMAGYVITLSITLIASYYLGFMILIFIFLYTGLMLGGEKLFHVARRKGRDKADLPVITGQNGKEEENPAENPNIYHITELGIGTVLSLAMSSFIIIPQLTQMLSSARFHNGNGSGSTGIIGKYLEILSHVRGDYTTRWWSLLGISFMSAVIATGLINQIRSRFLKKAESGADNKDERDINSTGITMLDVLQKKPVLTTVLLILMMVLELFFESINLIWHFGSYVQYPIRNGFIIYFVFAYLSCYFAGEMYCKEMGVDTDGKPLASDRSYLGFIFTVIGFLAFIAFYRNHPGMPLRRVFHITSAMMAAAFLYYMVLLNFETLKKSLHLRKDKRVEEEERVSAERRNKKRYRWAAGVLAFEVLCYGFLLFGKPDFITGYVEEPEQNGEYIKICEQLREKLGLEREFLYRIKNPDESLNANYGLALMQPALSNWTHMIAPGEQEGAAAWGYSIQFTRLLDSGGTVFSDALLGIRKIVSRVPMDESLYNAVDSAEVIDGQSGEMVEYTLYEPKYVLPFGAVLSGGEDIAKQLDTAVASADTVSLHNIIYNAMKAGDEDIAYWLIRKDSVKNDAVSIDDLRSKNGREVTIEAKIGEGSALYLLGSGGDREFANCTIEVSRDTKGNAGSEDSAAPETKGGTAQGLRDNAQAGESRYVTIPTIGDYDNIYYPGHFNNNAVYLGCYENESVRIKVTMDTEKGEDFEIDLMGVSLDKLEELCDADGVGPDEITAGNRTLSFAVNTGDKEDSIMLLPLTFDKGWKIMCNGHRVKASSMAGLFTAIPLEAGENTVTMKFTPPGMFIGTIISLIVLIVAALYIILMKVRSETFKPRAQQLYSRISEAVAPVYLIVFAVVLVFMYVIPVVYGVIVLLV